MSERQLNVINNELQPWHGFYRPYVGQAFLPSGSDSPFEPGWVTQLSDYEIIQPTNVAIAVCVEYCAQAIFQLPYGSEHSTVVK